MKTLRSKHILSSSEVKKFASNFFSLSVLQVFNYIIPIIQIPYLVRVLGPENFGLISFSTATLTYFVLITEYGFNYSATQTISINRNSKKMINEIFSSVMSLKFLLLIASLIFLLILITTIDIFQTNWDLFIINFGIVISAFLMPTWFFLGQEDMKYVTITNFFSRSIFTVCIFIFINDRSDYLLLPFFTGLGGIFGAIVCLYILHYKYEVNFKIQNTKTLLKYFKDGLSIYGFTMVTSIYTNSMVFILGLFTNNTIVGYYAAADKIIFALKGLFAPISQALYPIFSKKFQDKNNQGFDLLKKVSLILIPIMFLISLMMFIFAEKVVLTIFGDKFNESIYILKILSFVPFFISISNLYGIQAMLNLDAKKEFFYITIIGATCCIIAAFALIPIYMQNIAAMIVLSTEFIVAIASAIYVKKLFTRTT